MADSNIAKKALAAALKDLMTRMPLSKIRVADICEQCQMNRKSFYYHFKDKNDLIHWIFDTDFLSSAVGEAEPDRWETIEALFRYFYENRVFYRKVLKKKDQNCFSDHLKELLEPSVRRGIVSIVDANVVNLYADFVTNAAVGAIERWLEQATEMPDKAFFAQLKHCLYLSAAGIVEEAKQT